MLNMSDIVVQKEIDALAEQPVSEEERKIAFRAIARFKGAGEVELTEDWVRLYVALRRASGSQTVRLNASYLRKWRAKVSQCTIVKRKVFIVKKAALAELPAPPEDLEKRLLPRGELELPADIYEDDVVLIDDGYDRNKLNVPGVVHLEVAVK